MSADDVRHLREMFVSQSARDEGLMAEMTQALDEARANLIAGDAAWPDLALDRRRGEAGVAPYSLAPSAVRL